VGVNTFIEGLQGKAVRPIRQAQDERRKMASPLAKSKGLQTQVWGRIYPPWANKFAPTDT